MSNDMLTSPEDDEYTASMDMEHDGGASKTSHMTESIKRTAQHHSTADANGDAHASEHEDCNSLEQARSPHGVCSVDELYQALWRNQKKEPWDKRGLGGFMKAVVKVVMRTLGPMLIVLAHVLVIAVAYNYFAVIAPLMLGTFSIQWWIVTPIGVFFLIGILFNYTACAGTFPGHPSDVVPYNIIQATLDYKAQAASTKGSSGRISHVVDSTRISNNRPICKRCEFPKPPRTHHDSVLSECTCRMDHFCPWMGNTIGHFNYRFFYLSLVHLFAGCLFIVVLALAPAIALYNKKLKDKTDLNDEERFIKDHRTAILFSFSLCITMTIAVGLLLAWHTMLIQNNMTTIESYGTKSSARRLFGGITRNRFHMGTRANWEGVFGMKKSIFHFILPSFELPLGNGVDFPTTDKPEMLFSQRAEWAYIHHERKDEYVPVCGSDAHEYGDFHWYVAAAKYGHLRPFGKILRWLSTIGILEDPLKTYARLIHQYECLPGRNSLL